MQALTCLTGKVLWLILNDSSWKTHSCVLTRNQITFFFSSISEFQVCITQSSSGILLKSYLRVMENRYFCRIQIALDFDELPLIQSSAGTRISSSDMSCCQCSEFSNHSCRINKLQQGHDPSTSPSVVLSPAGTPDERQRYGWTISRISIMLLYLPHGMCPMASRCLSMSILQDPFHSFHPEPL